MIDLKAHIKAATSFRDFFDRILSYYENNVVVELVFILAFIAVSLVGAYFLHLLIRLFRVFIRNRVTALIMQALHTPLLVLFVVLLFSSLLKISKIIEHDLGIGMIDHTKKLSVVFCIVWFVLRYINALERHHLSGQSRLGLELGYVDVVAKCVKMIVIVVAIIAGMDVFGIDVRGLLTIAGVGGVAIAFASQGLLSNFFGTMVIYFDQPFSVGDHIKVGNDREGKVEYIGWRMTKLVTEENVPLYIPNSLFATDVLLNYSRRKYFCLQANIAIHFSAIQEFIKVEEEIKVCLQSEEFVNIAICFDKFIYDTVIIKVSADVVCDSKSRFKTVKTLVMYKISNILHENKIKIPADNG